MNDPTPIRSSSLDELALALLRSADSDGPRPDALAKTAVALGIGSSLLGMSAPAGAGLVAGAASTTGATATVVVAAKFLLVGAATGLAVSVGAHRVFRAESAPHPTAPAVVSSAQTMASAPGVARETRAPEPPRAVAPGATDSRSAEPPWRGEPFAETGPPPVAAFEPTLDRPAGPKSPRATELSEQVAMLDRARAALGRGQPREALFELDRYQQQWPAGLLSAEALVVRVAALVKMGDRATAMRLARPLMEAEPNGRHAAQLRELLADPRPE